MKYARKTFRKFLIYLFVSEASNASPGLYAQHALYYPKIVYELCALVIFEEDQVLVLFQAKLHTLHFRCCTPVGFSKNTLLSENPTAPVDLFEESEQHRFQVPQDSS